MGESTRSSPAAAAVVDASLDGAGLLEGDSFVAANETLAATFGYDDSEALLGRSWEALYPRAERERIADALAVLEGGWRGEVTGRRADGSPVPHLLSIRRAEDGRLVWIAREGAAARDGGETGRLPGTAGTGARKPEREGPPLPPVDAAPVPTVVFTAERGIVYANRRAAELVGAEDRAALLGTEPERFVHPEDRPTARRRIRRVLEGEATEPANYRLRGFDGEERFAEVAAAPVAYGGETAAYVLVNDVTDYRRTQEQLRRERRFVETVVDAVDDIVYVLDSDGETYLWNEALAETTGYSHDEIRDMHAMEVVPEDHHEYVPGLMEAIESIEDRRVDLDLLTKDGERVPHEFKGTTFEDPETGEVFRCGVARDITERLERERELETRLDELETLNRINRILLETTRELTRSASREVVERTVCARLVESDRYEFVWTGERALDGAGVVPNTTAGEGPVPTGSDVARSLADRAMRAREVRVAEDGSIAAVPVHHEGTTYGVLVVHTARDTAFSERERDSFAVLGRTVGYVVDALRRQRLLFTEAVDELEFHIPGADSPLARAAADLGCEVSLDGYVASGSRWVAYADVDGAEPAAVVDAVADDPGVERARVIGADAEARAELALGGASLLDTATRAGASVRTAVAGPEGVHLVVEAPVEAEIRDVVDHVRSEHPDAALLARRERDHERTAVGAPDGLLADLTSRQREALEVAYRAGYFAWPRDSTAEDVADLLEVAPATLHGHLRKAEAAILAALFEGE